MYEHITIEPGIYMIKNSINGKMYIGSAVNLRRRLQKHYRDLINGKHHCSHLLNSWLKYGQENFIFEVLEIVPRLTEDDITFKHKLVHDREQYYLNDLLHADKDNDIFENIAFNTRKIAWSNLGNKASAETKKKMSDKRKGTGSYWYGKKMPQHIKDKNRDAHLGKKASDDTKKKMSVAKNGKYIGEECWNFGRKHSEATLLKMKAKGSEFYNNLENKKRHSETMKKWWTERKKKKNKT